MSINEISERKWPVQRSMPSENALLAAVAVALLILPILAAVMLTPASAGPMTREEEVLLRLCD
jgi:hypothetical protein